MIPENFQPMLASVIPSQEKEVILGKQPIMSEYGREVRAVLSALPPEVSRSLVAEYERPSPQLLGNTRDAIMSRELAIEAAAQEQNLDKEWLEQGGKGRSISESELSADDEWNTPS